MLSLYLAGPKTARYPNLTINKAFTIIELIFTISSIGVLTSIAVPTFNSFVQKTEIKTLALRLSTSLRHARNHAIQNQVMVIVCPINELASNRCQPNRPRYANWQLGWLAYADLNNNNELDNTDDLLAVQQVNNTAAIIFNQKGRLRFFPRGTARSAGFYFCKKQLDSTQYIRLLHTGRNRISQKLSQKQHSECQNQLNI